MQIAINPPRRLTALILASIAIIVALFVAAIAPAPALAYTSSRNNLYHVAGKVSCTGVHARTYYGSSAADVMAAVEDMVSSKNNPMEESNVTIDLEEDWNTQKYGVIKFSGSGKHYTLNLHGHMINRGLTLTKSGDDWWGTGNGDAIRVCDGATLDVVGSTQGNDSEAKTEHKGNFKKTTIEGAETEFWKYNDNGSSSINGGLITGGACDDSNGGGGFTVQKNAKLNLTRVTVAGNVADKWNSSYGDGAGISVSRGGQVTLNDSTVSYNHAEGWGGGIYMNDDGALTVTNSNINNNVAQGYGGGIALDPGSNIFSHSYSTITVNVTGSSLSNNLAVKRGGALYDDGDASGKGLDETKVQFTKTDIKGNKSKSDGGAFAIDKGTYSLTFDTCTLNENVASGSGGLLYLNSMWEPGLVGAVTEQRMFNNSEICNNKAGADGGAICIVGINYGNSGYTESYLGSTKTLKGNHADGNGGAIAFISSPSIGTFRFDTGTTFESNSAGGKGGAIYTEAALDVGVTQDKGGLKFISNSAGDSGGAIYACGKGSINIYSDDNQTSFVGNSTSGTGNITSNNGGAIGIEVGSDYTMKVNNAKFEGNSASGVSGGGNGGAIWFMNQLEIKNTSITGNYASNNGGGVYCANDSYHDFTLAKKVVIDGNYKGTSAADKTVSNNLALKGKQTVCGADAGDAITSDSVIGITICDYGSSARQISGNADFVSLNLDEAWASCIYSDNDNCEVYRNGSYLYLRNAATNQYTLTVYSAKATKSEQVTKGVTVTLKSDDYKKTTGDLVESDWTLVSWTITSKGKTKTLTPEDGQVTFKMEGPTVARANYACQLYDMSITLDDVYKYDLLQSSDDPEEGDNSVEKTNLTFEYIDGSSKVIKDGGAFSVTKREVTEIKGATKSKNSKKVTYTVEIPASTISSNGLFLVKGAMPNIHLAVAYDAHSPAGVSDGLGTYTQEHASTDRYEVTSKGDVIFDFSVAVPYSNKHTVNFAASPDGSDYYTFSDGSKNKTVQVEDGKTVDVSAIPVPQKKSGQGIAPAVFTTWLVYDENSRSWVTWYPTTPITEDLKLIAGFTSGGGTGDHIVTFYDGTQVLGKQVVTGSGTIKAPSAPTKAGHTFDGWYSNSELAAPFDFDNTSISSDTSIYAKFTAQECKVTYDYNTPNVSSKTEEVDYGTKVTEAPTRTGYTFMGWYAGAKQYDADTPITSDVTLVAQWAVASYTVSFNMGGAPAIGKQTVEAGGYAIQPSDPTYAGHVFKGWYTDSSYNNVFDFAQPINAETTIYAKWAEAWTIKLYYTSGSASADETLLVEKDQVLSTLPTPSRNGYTFKGWKDAANKDVTAETVPSGNMELTAQWEANDCAVSFVDSLDGKAIGSSQTVKYGQKAAQPVDSPTHFGYEFDGWYEDKTCAKAFDFANTDITGDTTIYAKWKDKNFTVSFNVNGGTGSVDSQEVREGERAQVPASEPVRADYVFTGWFKNQSCTEAFDFKEPITSATTAYAGWNELVTVTFDSDGGTKYDSVTIPKGSCLDDLLPYPKMEDHYFGGWYPTDSEEKEVIYDTPIEASVTLKAKWFEGGELVAFVIDGKTDDFINVKAGELVPRPDDPVKDGYMFLGWFTDDDVEWDFEKDTVKEDFNLNAKWRELSDDVDEYTVKFDSAGGSAVADQRVESGSKVTKPADPTREGYTFVGWQLDGKDYDFSKPVTKSITLTAVWSKNAPGTGIEGAQVTLEEAKFAYNGKVQVAKVASVVLDGKSLEQGKDYQVGVYGGKLVGAYKVVVTGIGDYSGQVTAQFKIVPAKVIGVKAKAVGKGKAVKLTWASHKAQTTGFEVCWAVSKAKLAKGKLTGKATVKKASAKAYSAKKLKSGKRYYFKVRAYKVVDGKKYWSSWSKVKSAKAK